MVLRRVNLGPCGTSVPRSVGFPIVILHYLRVIEDLFEAVDRPVGKPRPLKDLVPLLVCLLAQLLTKDGDQLEPVPHPVLVGRVPRVGSHLRQADQRAEIGELGVIPTS